MRISAIDYSIEFNMSEDKSRNMILIVDDSQKNIDMLTHALKNDYEFISATDGVQALEYTKQYMPDLILLDVMMPDMDGYEVCTKLKADEKTMNIPVIFITGMGDTWSKARGFKVGAVDYIIKPFDLVEVRARVNTHISLKIAREELENQNLNLESKIIERTNELFETRLEIVYRLGRAAEYRDNETGMHIKRMSHYCVLMGLAAGMSEEECRVLLHATPMHDVGKIGIPDRVLLKPGELSRAEREIMKTHTIIGGEILSGHDSRELQMAQAIAMTHHEKWDGTGYPRGLKKEEIPLEGRIAGLCDVFDALISERKYKKAWPIEKAVDEIIKGKGTQFDPELVSLFVPKLDDILFIRKKYSEPDE